MMAEIAVEKEAEQKYRDFAKQVVWYPCEERKATDRDQFLVFLLAHAGPNTLDRAIKELGLTAEDFRKALPKARPGVFVYEEDWQNVNKELGIMPPLPFPRYRFAQKGEDCVYEVVYGGEQ